MYSVLFNGETHALEVPLSVHAFLEKMGLGGKRVAIERNGEVIPKSLQEQTFLSHGDHIEVIVAVGGG